MVSKLSIIIPLYNEGQTIGQLLTKIKKVNLLNNISKEIIIVNDGSSDDSETHVKDFIAKNSDISIRYFCQKENRGKGAAIRSGIKEARGDYLIIQDADLEYDPEEYNIMLKPIICGLADVVYGSRFLGDKPHRILFFWHAVGNKFLTFLSNMLTNMNLTDMECCYKLINTKLIQAMKLEENGFGFEPEVTAKLAKIKNIRLYEVGISYWGRTYAEGKKINWLDGLKAIYCIFKYNLF